MRKGQLRFLSVFRALRVSSVFKWREYGPGGSAGLQTRWAAPCVAGWVQLPFPSATLPGVAARARRDAANVMKIADLEFPEHLYYFVEHDTWARREDDGTVTVGISALGIALSGDLYMCRPKAVGSVVEAGRGIAVVELAKSIVSVKSPIAGKVVAINAALEEMPQLIHRDPYGAGWIARLAPVNWERDLNMLVTGEAIAPVIQERAWLMRQADKPNVAT